MLFSLLNLRKKTTAVIAGIAIAALCLWGLAMWQDISARELFNMFRAVVIMILVIILIAIATVTVIKLLWRLGRNLSKQSAKEQEEN